MCLYRTKIPQGELEGIDCADYAIYKGIPYGQPPVGPLRFRRPRPAVSWEGVRMAKKNPPIAWQIPPEPGSFYEKEFYRDDPSFLRMSEDCLYLNIWTPAQNTQERLPVLVWIHGGAFIQGFGHEREFDGTGYCKRGVILVTIQYRLGVLGFLSHPWLEEGGNLALWDQAAAIQWVYQNIGHFGGDCDKITLAGQSAGGVCVQAQLCNPALKGKLSGAILQSGGGYGQLERRTQSRAQALLRGEAFLEQCGIASPEMLMAAEPETLVAAGQRYGFPCRLVCGDGLIPEDGENCLYGAPGNAVPCLLGSTENDIRRTREMVKTGIPSDIYLGNRGFAEHYGGDSYLYYFDRALPGDDAGAFHSGELWYMFGTLKNSWRPFCREDEELSEKMLDLWSHFVKLGKPCPAEADWPKYERKGKSIRHFPGKSDKSE